MMLKAGLIVAVFMHMAWERLALIYAIILPPLLVLVFVALMVSESTMSSSRASPSSVAASKSDCRKVAFRRRISLPTPCSRKSLYLAAPLGVFSRDIN